MASGMSKAAYTSSGRSRATDNDLTIKLDVQVSRSVSIPRVGDESHGVRTAGTDRAGLYYWVGVRWYFPPPRILG